MITHQVELTVTSAVVWFPDSPEGRINANTLMAFGWRESERSTYKTLSGSVEVAVFIRVCGFQFHHSHPALCLVRVEDAAKRVEDLKKESGL